MGMSARVMGFYNRCLDNLLPDEWQGFFLPVDQQEDYWQDNACYGPPCTSFFYTVFAGFNNKQSGDGYYYPGYTEYIGEPFPPSARVVVQKIDLIQNRTLLNCFQQAYSGFHVELHVSVFKKNLEALVSGEIEFFIFITDLNIAE